jgi:hypothetical protein
MRLDDRSSDKPIRRQNMDAALRRIERELAALIEHSPSTDPVHKALATQAVERMDQMVRNLWETWSKPT